MQYFWDPRGGPISPPNRSRIGAWLPIDSRVIVDGEGVVVVGFLLWCILFVLCWPVAVVGLILYPIVWLLLLPLRLIGITVGAVLALVKAIIFLPARLLGHRPGK